MFINGRPIEMRSLPVAGARDVRTWHTTVELRDAAAADGPRTIGGYGARFNEETVVFGLWREKFLPGSLIESLRSDDVLCTFNHDPNQLLGRRANGTARFDEDAAGATYSVDLNLDDPDAQRVVAKVQRRDVSGASLVFRVDDDGGEEWVRDDPAKLPLRIIKRARVLEMGPVVMPYYQDTTAAARSQAETFAAADIATAAAAQRSTAAVIEDGDRLRRLQLLQISTR